MTDIPADIYTEPDGDPDTIANLGPLAPLAGIWQGTGADEHPVAPSEGWTERDAFVERHELQPLDFQTNGPQLFYPMRYHTHIVKPGEVAMFHDQVGYWLWEPATGTIVMTLAIPRGQVLLASGRCDPDATTFTVGAERGSPTFGIASNPFLDAAFQTLDFRLTVTVNADGTWSYEEHTRLLIPDRDDVFDHVDRNTLRRVAPPTPNPLARAATASAAATGPNPEG